jgi:hypothetical protein
VTSSTSCSSTPIPSTGMRFVVDTGLAPYVVPELAPAGVAAPATSPWPLEVLAAVPAGHRLARWAALFVEHAPDVVRARLRALRASSADVAEVSALVELHRWVVGSVEGSLGAEVAWSDGEVRRLAHRAGALLDDLLVLAVAAAPAGPSHDRHVSRLDDLAARVRLLSSREDLGALRPELDGAEVMGVLELQPGRQVGEAMAFLLDLRLDRGPIGRDAATEALREWWTRHST